MSLVRQRTDFNIDEFSRILNEKGYTLLHQKAVLCSCATDDGQNLASCEYCNNTGRRYVSTPVEIQAILTSMGRDVDLRDSGMTITGLVSVTTYASSRLSFLDKLTLMDGKIVYNEIIDSMNKIPRLKYPVLDIEVVADLHNVYNREVDYDIINGSFTWLKPVSEPFSIRYITYPVFIVLNFPNIIRGTVTKLKQPNLSYAELPVKAISKLEFRVTDRDTQ